MYSFNFSMSRKFLEHREPIVDLPRPDANFSAVTTIPLLEHANANAMVLTQARSADFFSSLPVLKRDLKDTLGD